VKRRRITPEQKKSLDNTLALFAELHQIFTPPPLLTVDEWADQYRVLHSESAGVGGPWRTNVMPCFREIMRAYSDPATKRIVIKGAVRIGKTQSMVLNVIGYHVHLDPRRIMVALPSKELMQDFVSTKLGPLLRNTECLRGKVHAGGRKGGRSNETLQTFDGGAVAIANANIASSFRQREVDTAIGDEIDDWPLDVDGEGDPVKLLENRVINSPIPKIVLISSPTLTDSSRIQKAYEDSDQGIFEIPCPGCGHFQTIVWERIEFKNAEHACEKCQCTYNQWHWLSRGGEGRWRQLAVGHPTRGFMIPGLISPWLHWEELINDFLHATKLAKLGDLTMLKAFRTTILAETWDVKLGEKLDEDHLYDRREVYSQPVPEEALVVTAGVDTQDSWLSYSIWAWGKDHECWGVEAGWIDGDPLKKETWDELTARVVNREWLIGDRVIKVNRVMIDYQGHRTTSVYNFTRAKGPRVYACRGVGGESKAEFKNFPPKGDQPSIVEFYVDSIKAELTTRLKVESPGPSFVHFPRGEDRLEVSGFTSEWFTSLCCERLTEKTVNGYTSYIWKKPDSVRNEGIDTFTYAWGALQHMGGGRLLEFEAQRREKELELAAAKDQPPQPPKPARFGAAPAGEVQVTYTKLPHTQTGTVISSRPSRFGAR
jgi:phage terminase large subunit GpA-like protein